MSGTMCGIRKQHGTAFLCVGDRVLFLRIEMVTQTTMRVILRWLHIILGLVIMCYIYSPFHDMRVLQIVVKFIVIPAITISGLWIWKFKAFNRFFGIRG